MRVLLALSLSRLTILLLSASKASPYNGAITRRDFCSVAYTIPTCPGSSFHIPNEHFHPHDWLQDNFQDHLECHPACFFPQCKWKLYQKFFSSPFFASSRQWT